MIGGVLMVCVPSSGEAKEPPAYVKHQIMIAVESVAGTFGSMHNGGGYQRWTPQKAVDKLVPLMNSATAPGPGDSRLPGSAGNITYVKDEVTGPWQIVLIALEKEQKIRVEGYAYDTSVPVYTKEIHVSEW